MKKNRYSLGIDIGGTYIKSAICREDGETVFFMEHETPNTTPSKFLNLVGYIGELTIKESAVPGFEVIGVGVGFPGTVNHGSGFVDRAPNIKGWKRSNVRLPLEKWFSKPVVLNNDANLALLAEKMWGVAKDVNFAVELTLGTGVGGGVLIGGNLYYGADGYAAELGHVVIDINGPRCSCGKYGCLEVFSGAQGFVNEAKEVRKKDFGSLLWSIDNGDITPLSIQKAAESSDKMALLSLKNSSRYLAYGISSFIDIFNPEMIILGGGLSRFDELLLKPLVQELKRIKPISPIPKIVSSRFKEKAGVIGACASVFMEQT